MTHPKFYDPLDIAVLKQQSLSTSLSNACGKHGCIHPRLIKIRKLANWKLKGRRINATERTVIARHFTWGTTAFIWHSTNSAHIALVTSVILFQSTGIPPPLSNGVPVFDFNFHNASGVMESSKQSPEFNGWLMVFDVVYVSNAWVAPSHVRLSALHNTSTDLDPWLRGNITEVENQQDKRIHQICLVIRTLSMSPARVNRNHVIQKSTNSKVCPRFGLCRSNWKLS